MTSIRDTIASTPNTYFMVAADHPFECPCACCLRFLHEGLTSLAPEDRPSNIDFDEIVDCDHEFNRNGVVDRYVMEHLSYQEAMSLLRRMEGKK